MKKPKAVEVIWIDAHGGHYPEWQKLEEKHHRKATVRTVGLVRKESEAGLTIVLSLSDEGDCDAYVFIPIEMILEVTEL